MELKLKAQKKFLEEIRRKNIIEAKRNYLAKLYNIVRAVKERQKKASQRFLLSKFKINIRNYLDRLKIKRAKSPRKLKSEIKI
jgi:hypothetical protein